MFRMSSPISHKPLSIENRPLSEWARPIFQDWEKLRIIYNVVLIFVTLLYSMALIYSEIHMNDLKEYAFFISSLIGVAFFGAVFANVCFFAGPILEVYPKWLGAKFHIPRIPLFIAGTLFASFLALCALAEVSMGLIFL
jgi:hypothetical protein